MAQMTSLRRNIVVRQEHMTNTGTKNAIQEDNILLLGPNQCMAISGIRSTVIHQRNMYTITASIYTGKCHVTVMFSIYRPLTDMRKERFKWLYIKSTM